MYSSLVNLVSDTTTQNVTKSYAGVLCYRLKKISLQIVESFNTCTGLKKKKKNIFAHNCNAKDNQDQNKNKIHPEWVRATCAGSSSVT